MPERHGYKVDGGWAEGGDNVNGTNFPQNLTINSRNINGEPVEYKASQFIEFVDGFESGNGDEFLAFIADGGSYAGGTTSGSGGESNSYRHGFNGKENDDEVKGVGNQIDFGARIYDARISKWLSLDPLQKKYPYETNYAFVSNSPVIYKDPDGKDKIVTIITITDHGVTMIQRIDKKYFHAEAQSKFYGGYDYMKYNVYRTEIIDKRTNNSQKLDKAFNNIDYSDPISIDFWEYAKEKIIATSGGSINNFGYILKGNSGNGYTLDLGGKAYHFEDLDIGLLLENAKNIQKLNGKNSAAGWFKNAISTLEKVTEGKIGFASVANNQQTISSTNLHESNKERPDSATCDICTLKQDSSHIDLNVGKGTFEKLKKEGNTEQTKKPN